MGISVLICENIAWPAILLVYIKNCKGDIFKPGARRPQAGARLVYRNHFDADVGMCVYVCVCVCVCLCVRPPGY